MKLSFKSGILFGENLIGCEMGKVKVIMNKLVYLCQAILDLSKIVMYEFHYDYMIRKYDNLRLCYMDTDSFVYDIQTADIVDDVLERFDTSSYLDRPLPIGKNRKVIGMMKDELGGKIMTDFVALRPKSYTYKFDFEEDEEDGEKKKCKGIEKCIIKKTTKFDNYVNCLLNGTNEYRSQLTFRSNGHEVHMIEVNKFALNRDDDKRIIKKDGIGPFAGEHKSLCWNLRLGEVSLI